MPTLSQMDPAILAGLPDDVRAEAVATAHQRSVAGTSNVPKDTAAAAAAWTVEDINPRLSQVLLLLLLLLHKLGLAHPL